MERLSGHTPPRLRDRLLDAAMRLPPDTELATESVRVWDRYIGGTELRIARQQYEPESGTPFILDFSAAGDATRRRLFGGEILIETVSPAEAGGEPVAVPCAVVEHARGAVFLRGASLAALVTRLRANPSPALPADETVRLYVVEEGDQAARIAVRISRVESSPVLYDAEFDVRVRHTGRTRAVVRSMATTVEELGLPVAQRGTNRRRRGSLWRLGAFWCFESVPGGVLAGCEWLMLRRELPWPLRMLAGPSAHDQAPRTLGRLLRALRREAPMIPMVDRRLPVVD